VVKDPKSIIAKVEKELGPIDVLINNAGSMRMARFAEENDIDAWWSVFEINVKAPMALINAALPSMISRATPSSPKTIITVGSAAADLTIPFMTSYNASKAAIQKSLQILDLELRPQNVFNFVIHPGSIPTDLNQAESAYGGKEMSDIGATYKGYMDTKLPLPADSMVALAGSVGKGKGVEMLSGRLWDVEDDLEEIIAKTDDIEDRGLYHLRIRKL
jgi:NADP-dependent 3-hydroxy acid dehydrogenase YdfG